MQISILWCWDIPRVKKLSYTSVILQCIQNAAVRFIFGLKGKERFQSITPYLKDLHFLPVEYRIQFKIALLTFKCLNNIAPEYLKEMISLKKDSSKSLRVDNDFYLLQQPAEPRCSHTRGAFSYSAPKVWNQLPYSLRSMVSINVFKSALKTHIFRKAFRNDGGSYEFNIDILIYLNLFYIIYSIDMRRHVNLGGHSHFNFIFWYDI